MIKLLPRQEAFFDLFEQQAETVNKGAHCLAELLSNFKNIEDVAFKLKATEHDGDEIAHEIIRKLNTTFVTPLDREDIHSLASALDDILDYIETASDRMALYEVKEPTEASIKLSAILAKSTELTLQAVRGLRDMKNAKAIRDVCVEINRLENQGDQVNRAALAELFKMTDKPVEALKWREIYGHIETAIDKCEDVAEIIESTLLKNA
jgi:predicted phosphate transport protein (TIGR00153 family)